MLKWVVRVSERPFLHFEFERNQGRSAPCHSPCPLPVLNCVSVLSRSSPTTPARKHLRASRTIGESDRQRALLSVKKGGDVLCGRRRWWWTGWSAWACASCAEVLRKTCCVPSRHQHHRAVRYLPSDPLLARHIIPSPNTHAALMLNEPPDAHLLLDLHPLKYEMVRSLKRSIYA